MSPELPLILHHFDASPFAEKVRLALGIKGLSWNSVEIPMVMPKPKLTALTGGYRKTPVLQIGADVYCDTRRIAIELENRFPSPSLFPDGRLALAMALTPWSDDRCFRPGAALSMGTNGDLPEPVLADRRAFFDFLDFSTLSERLPHYFSQFQAQLALLDRMLAEGDAPCLAGDAPGWVDVLAYFPLWMARGNIANSGELVESLPSLLSWERRMAAVGHGERSAMDADDALDLARWATSTVVEEIVDDSWPRGFAEGDAVVVSPDDYGRNGVEGHLARLAGDEIAIHRHDPLVGDVVVHFPRTGYELRRK